MAHKHLGGRGRKTRNKYQVFSVSIPPELKILLDSWVTEELSRSEVVAQLIQAHADRCPKSEAEPQSPVSSEGVRSRARQKTPTGSQNPSQYGKRGKTERLVLTAPALQVLTSVVPRGKKWKPEKYAHAERLLAQGNILQAQGLDYVTQAGEVMSWRTAEALVGFGVLQPLEM